MSKLVAHPTVSIIDASADCLGWSGEAKVFGPNGTFFVSFENTECPEEAMYWFDNRGKRFYEPVDPTMDINGISFGFLKELLREALDKYEA